MKQIGLSTLGIILPGLLLTACQDKPGESAAGDAAAINSAAPNSAAGPAASPPVASAPAAPAERASDYLAQAGAGDLFEIESSRAVLAKTGNAKVRDFAQMMVKAHQESTAKLKAAASRAKLTVKPPVLTPDQQSMLDRIKTASADNMDAVYVANQKAAHQAALALHQGYAATGDTPALKQAASEIVPVVQSHIRHLSELPSK